jgi:glycosyltransferase involved in cell wall biosynthesis
MLEGPFISVCTPVYNGEKFLEECIKGVLAQRYGNFEYIIVDNASTDRTAEIIERYRSRDSRIRVFRNHSTIHVVDNFQKCAQHCSDESRWIKYICADDYLFPNCLVEMVRVGELTEGIGLVSAYRLYGDRLSNAGLPVEQAVFKGKEILKRQLMRQLHVCSSSPTTLMYRKTAFHAVGGFNNKYLHADTELAMRLLDNYDLGFSHFVLSKTGLHEGRIETYSVYTGNVIREYLDFGFANLKKYRSITFTEEELDLLTGFYTIRLNEFIAKKLAHLDFQNIKAILSSCPDEVKGKLLSALRAGPGRYLRAFAGELAQGLRGTATKLTFRTINRNA